MSSHQEDTGMVTSARRISISALVGGSWPMLSGEDVAGTRDENADLSRVVASRTYATSEGYGSGAMPAFDTLVEAASTRPGPYVSAVRQDVHPLAGGPARAQPSISQLPGAVYKTRRGKRHRCLHEGCGREFTRLSNLKAHGRKHSGVEPYACMYCARRFKWRSSLKSHENGCVQQDNAPAMSLNVERYTRTASLPSPYDSQGLPACSLHAETEETIYIPPLPRSELRYPF